MSKYEEVRFEKNVRFLGRNGLFKSMGVCVDEFEGAVNISPITSKDLIGRCCIEIPIESIPELIEALQKHINK